MNDHRKTGIMVGVLNIIGTAAGILRVVFIGPVQANPDYGTISVNGNQVILAALFVLVIVGAVEHMSTHDGALRIPLGVREMILAAWLMSIEFNPFELQKVSA